MPLSECNTTIFDFNRAWNLPMFHSGVDKCQYCAYDPLGYQDSCEGDSGGPLHTVRSFSSPPKLVGVVSFGTCGRVRTSIYSRVAHFIPWIGSHVWPSGKIETLKINNNEYK